MTTTWNKQGLHGLRKEPMWELFPFPFGTQCLTDKASDYESGDSRFKSWRGRCYFESINFVSNGFLLSFKSPFTKLWGQIPHMGRSYVCYRSIAAFVIKKYWMFIEFSPASMMKVTFSKMQPTPVELWCFLHLLFFPIELEVNLA